MTIEPPTSDSTGPNPDIDPLVTEWLRPLAVMPAPDVWADAVRRAARAGTGSGPTPDPTTASSGTEGERDMLSAQCRRRSGRPLVWAAVAAGLVVAIGAGIAAGGRGRGQDIETPATGPADTVTPASAGGFPDGVDPGPALTDDALPVGAFAVVYPAGVVVVEADGTVVGHYTGQVPGVVYDPARGTLGRLMGAPDGCTWDSELTVLYCRDAVGPTVEVPGGDGVRRVLASFPPPPPGIDPGATVVGHVVRSFAQPGVERGRPLLLQMSAECETRLALMVDNPTNTDVTDRGGDIRRLDGASYWDEPTMAGQSLALGWSPDGGEAYVWRFDGACAPALEQPGIYAYRLDGSARLLLPTPPDVVDVQLITGEPPTYGPGAITPLPPFPATSTTAGAISSAAVDAAGEPTEPARPEGWAEWAGPLRPQRADDPALADDRRRALEFARLELGMVDPEVLATSTVDPGPDWILTERDLSLRINPYAASHSFAAPATVQEPWQQVSATTFWPDGNYSLSVKVDDDTGRWQATVNTPAHGAVLTASYAVGGAVLDPSTTVEDGVGGFELTFDLQAEPTDVAVLTIKFHAADTGHLVGYQRTPLPPGRFAAG